MLHANAEELKAGLTGTTLARSRREFSRNAVNPPAPGAIQAKSAINKPGDENEQEADRVSETVMRMPEQLQHACACGAGCPRCQSQTEQPGQNTERIQTTHVRESDADDVNEAPPGVDEVLRSPAQLPILLRRSAVNAETTGNVASIAHDVQRSSGQPLDANMHAFTAPRVGPDFNLVHALTSAPRTRHDKLSVSQPNDYFEKEADRVADDVMRISGGTPDSPVTKDPVPQRSSLTRQERPHRNTLEGIEDQPMPEDVGLPVSPQTETEVRKAVGSGAPMPEPLRDFFEPRFGHNFSHVRIHTGQMAESASQSLRAVAFTFGSNIFFNSGQYRTNTGSGLGLLAHELAHVIQQKAGSVSRRLIQRAVIPYRQITWADFLATPPNTPASPEGAGILTRFDMIPSYTAVITAKATKKKCRVGKTRPTEVESTAAPDPADFNKPEAVMDQDQSWALARYTGNGNNYCTGEATKCENEFDSIAAQIRTNCEQTADECKRAFDRGQKSFGYGIGNDTVEVTSKAKCMTTLLTKCQEFNIKRSTVSVGATTVRAKADCKRPFFQRCMVNEGAERPRLLKHEQGHFDITNVMAKNARESLSLKAATLPVKKTGCGEDAARDAARLEYNTNVKDVLINLGRDWTSSKDRAQTDYDNETGNGAKAAEQKAWEAKIKAGLKDYYPTTAPAPAAAPATTPATPPATTTPARPPATPSPAPTPTP